MTVWIDDSRKTVAFKFNNVTGDTFTLRATRKEDDKAHSSGPHKLELNDDGVGSFVETFPSDFTGAVFVEVTGSDGSRSEGHLIIH